MISILYVDDESLLLDTLKQFLEKDHEFVVSTALSTREALDMLTTTCFDAIISDYEMPEIDGIAFLKMIREKYPDLPFLIFTGKGREEIVIESINNGADFYVRKGGDLKSQFAELSSHVKKAVLLRENTKKIIRLNRIYLVQNRVNEAVLHIHDPLELMKEACTIAVQEGEFLQAKIVVGEDKNSRWITVSAKKTEDGFTDITVAEENPFPENRPTGIAIRQNHAYICNNVCADPNTETWREEARDHHYRSLASFPFRTGKTTRGAITFFSGDTNVFTSDEIQLLTELSDDLTFALETIALKENQAQVLEELEHTSQRFMDIINFLPVPTFAVNKAGTVIIWNKAMENLTGFGSDEAIGRENSECIMRFTGKREPALLDLLSATDKELASHHYTQINRTKKTISAELDISRAHGPPLRIWAIASPLYDKKRKVNGAIESIRDITTERRTMEQYRQIVETANEGIGILDKNRIITFANTRMEKMLGYAMGELTGKSVDDVLFEEDHGEHDRHMEEHSRGKRGTYEQKFRHKNQRAVWCFVSATPVIDADGSFSGSFVMVTDISKRKKTEEALRQSEETYRTVFENTGTAMVLINEDTTISLANGEFAQLSGYTRQEIEGKKKWTEFVDSEDVEWMLAQHRMRRQNKQEALPKYEFRFRTKSGEIRDIYLVIDLIPGTTMSAASLLDITEHKKAEMALHRAGKKLNLLTGITRHDILNQLTALEGFLELSDRFLCDPEKQKQYIEKEKTAAAAIRNQILFTREYEELGVKSPVWKNVNQCLQDSVAFLPMRNIRVVPDRTDLELYVDPLYSKVCYNLIENSLKYGGEKLTRINVSSHETDTGLIMMVEDDGQGICKEDKAHLFERGYGKNTGLGLFFSREILLITGITISETSEQGKGARFEIHVPKGGYRFSETSPAR
jgi:PAS domain S-box-containing protein